MILRDLGLITVVLFVVGAVLVWWCDLRVRATDRPSVGLRLAHRSGIGLLCLACILLTIVAFPIFVVVLVVGVSTKRTYDAAERDALFWIIASSAQRGISTQEAVRAYADERGGGYGNQLRLLSDFLDAGVTLGTALQRSGIRARPDIVLALELGERTGDSGPALHRALAYRTTEAHGIGTLSQQWGYLIAVFVVEALVTGFIAVRLLPVWQKILRDFGVADRIGSARVLHDVQNFFDSNTGIAMEAAILLIGILAIVAYIRGTSLREVPFLRRLWYRADCANSLFILGNAIQRNRSIVDTLRLIATYQPQPKLRRALLNSSAHIDRGLPWTESLRKTGIVSSGECGLIQAAERTGNLPWALAELGESGLRRWRAWAEASSSLVFTLVIFVAGLGVLGIACATIVPLFELIRDLSF